MLQKKSFYLFIIAALFILSGATVGLAGAQGGGEVRAVDLLGAWVDGSAPNGDFAFTGTDGNAYTANFEADILPLFTASGVWFDGSQACTDCHFDNSEDSYHEMDLSSYEGIMAGGDVLSHPPGVPLLGQSAVGETDFDWDGAKLRSRLRNNRMPPGWEFDITEENRDGPALVAGHAGGDAPVTLPESGGDNSMMAWILAAVGLVALLAGMAIRRREQVG